MLLGDVDGDGVADLVYVDDGRVLLWGNQSGNGWTEQPVIVTGTPASVDTDAIQLADLHGTGMAGLLFSRAAGGPPAPGLAVPGPHRRGQAVPADRMDNHLGRHHPRHLPPSTAEYLRDQADPATRWRTTLPFPVQVVAAGRGPRRASPAAGWSPQYRYHHGYWDGVEREFRGFALVEQLDTETFDRAAARCRARATSRRSTTRRRR